LAEIKIIWRKYSSICSHIQLSASNYSTEVYVAR
jgi:hypothetical protein